MRRLTIVRMIVGSLLAIAIITSLVLLPVKDYGEHFLGWVKDLGPVGAIFIALAYVPACLLFVPGSILSLGAGFAFGVLWGTIAVSIGSVAGATAAFFAGRTLMREWIERRVKDRPKFSAIDRAVADEGFKIVLLTRLSPVFPFNLLNYAFGLTRVTPKDYVFASWVGMLPGTLLYVYLGSAASRLADILGGDVAGGIWQQILFWGGLVAAFVVALIVTRIARRALREATAQSDHATGDSEVSARKSSHLSQSQIDGAPHVA